MTGCIEWSNWQAYVNQVDPSAAATAAAVAGGVPLPYNSPIGLYSKENAITTLKQTIGHAVPAGSGIGGGGGVHLMPDNVVMEGTERKLNLAASPTFRMIQAMEGPGRQHEAVSDRVYSPIPAYVPSESGADPKQSASFNVSLLASPASLFLRFLTVSLLSFDSR